jgi:nicotinamide riboside transporter PnuC
MISELLFVGLNVADACFTRVVVSAGLGTEGNLSLVAQTLGSNILAKALLAAVAILIMRRFGGNWCLWLANIGIFGVVLWNGMIYAVMIMCKSTSVMLLPF